MGWLGNQLVKFKEFCRQQGPQFFFGSVREVTWLTTYAVFPLILNIFIGFIFYGEQFDWTEKLVPGEMISYSMSFLSTMFYLFVKSNKSKYTLPYYDVISWIANGTFYLSLFLYICYKNEFFGWKVDSSPTSPFYLWSISSFFIALFLRIYATYHGKAISSYPAVREENQQAFNSTLNDKIAEQR